LDGQTYYCIACTPDAPGTPSASPADGTVHFLPAFDEYIIAYTDRSAVLSSIHHSKAVSSNGIFRPTILRNGIVVGTWKNVGKKRVDAYFEKDA
jgi:hypothetical protein